MSVNPTPEDGQAEAEAVLNLQQAVTAEGEDEVLAHDSTKSIAFCVDSSDS